MTNKVNPSPFRPTEAFKTAGAIAHGGHGGEGYVVDGFTDIAEEDGNIDETQFNNFQESHSTTSFDVTIDPGEAFVFGAWLAIDTATTVTLASSTNNQKVYIAWEEDTSDTVEIGTDADTSGANSYYERIPLWEFDTDGSGVTAARDLRRIGYSEEITGKSFYGNEDFSLSYQATPDELELKDEVNDVVKQTWDKSGDTHIPSGALNFRNSNNIQDAGTDALSFDGSQNVTISNGDLDLSGNGINNLNNINHDTGSDLRLNVEDADKFVVDHFDTVAATLTDLVEFGGNSVNTTFLTDVEFNRSISFSGANSIKLSNTDAISFDNDANVEIPNGNLYVPDNNDIQWEDTGTTSEYFYMSYGFNLAISHSDQSVAFVEFNEGTNETVFDQDVLLNAADELIMGDSNIRIDTNGNGITDTNSNTRYIVDDTYSGIQHPDSDAFVGATDTRAIVRGSATTNVASIVFEDSQLNNVYRYDEDADEHNFYTDLIPAANGSYNVGTSSDYFNEMHATSFVTHSPESRSTESAMQSVEEYVSGGYGSMEMEEMVANLVTMVKDQQETIERLKEELQ